MGCHTWIYTKVDSYTKEMDEFLKKYCTKVTYEENGTISGRYEVPWGTCCKWFTESKYLNPIAESPNETVPVTDINKVPEEIRHLFYIDKAITVIPDAKWSVVFDEQGIYKDSGYHDLFRITNYPDVRIHSYEEAEKFINSEYVVEEFPEGWDDCEDHFDKDGNWYNLYKLDEPKSVVLDRVKKFYDEHPGTLIVFG